MTVFLNMLESVILSHFSEMLAALQFGVCVILLQYLLMSKEQSLF